MELLLALAAVHLDLAGDHLEQRGLTGAVAAHQAQALAGIQRQVGLIQQRGAAEVEADGFEGEEHWGVKLVKRGGIVVLARGAPALDVVLLGVGLGVRMTANPRWATRMTEQTYERLALAKEQLDTALDLFLDQKKHSCAITLAGAAEEIFGRALNIEGRKSSLDSSYESMAEFHRMFHGEKLNRKKFVSEENLARDALKHLQQDKGPSITVDLEDAACWMLVRAIDNGRKLGLEFERFGDFDNWFYENVVGV